MVNSNIGERYFKWLCQVINCKRFPSRQYSMLLRHLYNTEFIFSIPMDANRAEDGIDLRYRYGRDTGCSDYEIANELDLEPCNMLEMMVALALRCEEQIMANPKYGNRTSKWFWDMICSLQLSAIDDNLYPGREGFVDNILHDLFDHNYAYDGFGGLFTLRDATHDMRTAEIWYQMNWYLNELLPEEDIYEG